MRLRYTRLALTDLDAILDYIEERSPHGAARVWDRIQAVTALLLKYPQVGTATSDPVIRRIATTPIRI